ncbi:hypothetical protein [Nonomuraea rosea]|uniref:hypothetical protein n=1 Tax=Nonomuraea rosea TaxID=638574 RepID=UPI003CD0B021
MTAAANAVVAGVLDAEPAAEGTGAALRLRVRRRVIARMVHRPGWVLRMEVR